MIARGFRIGNGQSCSIDSNRRGGKTDPFALSRNGVDVHRLDRDQAGGDALRVVLSRYLGLAASDIRIDRTCALCGGQHGKPVLDMRVHGPNAPHFSLSRSGAVTLVAVGASPLGVDVEVERQVDAAGIAAHLFSPGEAALIGSLKPAMRLPAFLTLWTRKEALGKALALGLSDEVLATDLSGSAGLVDLATLGSWTLFDIDAGIGAKAALATSPDVTSVRLVRR